MTRSHIVYILLYFEKSLKNEENTHIQEILSKIILLNNIPGTFVLLTTMYK